MEDVVLLAYMREMSEAAARSSRELLHKRMRLDSEEALRKLHENIRCESIQHIVALRARSRFGRLGQAIIDNIQFNFFRLHFRYEHPTAQGRCFACGAAIQCLEVRRTDERCDSDNYGPEKMSGGSIRTWHYRMLHLRGVSFYWLPEAPLHDAEVNPSVVNLPQPAWDAVLLPPSGATLQVRMLRDGARAEEKEPRSRWTCCMTQQLKVALMPRQLDGMIQVPAWHSVSSVSIACQVLVGGD